MIKLSTPQLLNMLELQNTLNERVTPDWRSANYPWYRAAWLECAELLDHISWKWWKAGTMDVAQARMEVIDIWHFALSHALQELGSDTAFVASKIRDDEALARAPLEAGWNIRKNMHGEAETLRMLVEEQAAMCLEGKSVSPAMTLELADRVGLDAATLYTNYVAKNVLNIFRQDHGYKEGTYQKLWHEYEDNVHVADILGAYPDIAPAELLSDLEGIYASHLNINALLK